MKKTVKEVIKSTFVYRFLLFIYVSIKALQQVRVDIYSLRELAAHIRGFPMLDKKIHRFLKNFADHVLNKDKRLIVVDIGANDGWFAKSIFRFSPHAKVISFEPLKSQQAKLALIKKQYPNFSCFSSAVGDKECSMTITEYKTSGLSSLRRINSAYSYFEGSGFSEEVVNEYRVDVVTLDKQLSEMLSEQDKVVLKIDTQGYELEVLKGACALMKRGAVKCILIELMTIKKYAGMVLYNEILEFLHERDFVLYDLCPFYYEKNNGRLSEIDAIFMHQSILNEIEL